MNSVPFTPFTREQESNHALACKYGYNPEFPILKDREIAVMTFSENERGMLDPVEAKKHMDQISGWIDKWNLFDKVCSQYCKNRFPDRALQLVDLVSNTANADLRKIDEVLQRVAKTYCDLGNVQAVITVADRIGRIQEIPLRYAETKKDSPIYDHIKAEAELEAKKWAPQASRSRDAALLAAALQERSNYRQYAQQVTVFPDWASWVPEEIGLVPQIDPK